MSTCTTGDIEIFNAPAGAALNTCIVTAQGDAMFPTAAQVQTCLDSAGISAGCSECWGNIFGDFKSCFIDICDLSVDTPLDAELPAGCADCLGNLASKANANDSVCGLTPSQVSTDAAVTVTTQLQRWATSGNTSGAAAPVSLRSITTSVVIFGLLMAGL